MIELKLESYCQNCPEFEPHVDKTVDTRTVTDPYDYQFMPTTCFGAKDYKEETIYTTHICCQHRRVCASIYACIKDSMGTKG